ncbi:MAG: Rpn family recombination-promoting nuclease/putative transposase, partial [Treponema sp.]|nr:Rpn family recombination-promoting nuclease/putative transposase [Treponema sp.]
MSVNNRYKDSVFSLLFSNPDTLRELYNALEGVNLPPAAPITINTLSDVLFMERINDISFEIAGKLVVVMEHQSTINPNMPLRCLIYLTRLYEKIIDSKDMYKNRVIPLPQPECFVLYNGKAEYPDETILKISDAFVSVKELGITEKLPPDLELIVRVININQGRNEEVIGRCEKLREYSAFIATAREYEGRLRSREAGVRAAVKYCIEQRILEGFLKEHGSEVVNMLFTEWNWDDALAVRYEEGK